MDRFPDQPWICPVCARVHQPVALRVGERALCTVCGSTLARHQPRGDVALAFTVTAAILAVPAMQLPLVSVGKFGNDHASRLWTGIVSLWQHGMPLLAVWVALCGIVVPLALVGALAVLLARRKTEGQTERLAPLTRWVRALSHWAMPEVHVLGVLVAFVKIGSLVHVTVRPGLWCYAAMAIAILFAWRSTSAVEARA